MSELMRKTAQFIEERKAAITLKPKRKPRGRPFQKGNKFGPRFKKGQSGNPGGKPGVDLASVAARILFEQSPGKLPNIPKGFNAYGFSVLADRAYGKVKDKSEVAVTGSNGGPLEITVKLVKADGDSSKQD